MLKGVAEILKLIGPKPNKKARFKYLKRAFLLVLSSELVGPALPPS